MGALGDTIVVSFEPEKVPTLDEFIRTGKRLSLSHENNMLKYKLNDHTVIPMRGLLHKYHNALQRYVIQHTMTDAEFARWKYQPKLLCRELYGTPELWADILFLNDMTSCVEFTKRGIKVYSTLIIDAISEILMLYNKDITNNRKECKIEEET